MTKYFSIRFVILCLVAIAMTSAIYGQATGGTGQITGVVADANGAVVPNATVTLTSKATNQTQTTTSTEDGIYRFVNLQPGVYSVKTSSGSFAPQTLEVEVQVGRTTDANFTLGAGDVSAVVEVNAEGIQTTSSSFDSVTSETAIQNLPINGRRFQDFVTLTPTAQVDPQRGQISLSGQRGINGNINVDGVDYNQPFFGGIRGGERANLAFTLPQEAVREFQVVAAGYSAEFGRSTGGIVNAVTKSGTNDFRGSAFYLWRPEELARGNNFTQALQEQRLNAAGVDATLAPTQHQFGGSLGGPIIKDKLFFFASYEQQIFNAPRQIIFNFPTGYARPADPALAAVYDFYKNLEEPYDLTNDAYALLGKVDWNINDNNRFNIRYNWSQNEAINAVSRGESSLDPTTNQALTTNGIEKNNNNIVVAQMITNFTSNLINEGRFQWAREERPRESNSVIPQVQTSFATLGATAFLPTTQYDTRWQFGDSLTWIKGNHTIKFGGEYSNLFASQVFGFNQFGQYTMNIGSTAAQTTDILTRLANVATILPPPTGSTTPTVILGRFDDTRARYNRQIGDLLADFTVKELSFFAQDQWRVTPKFSLNFGVRFEQQYNPSPEANNTQVINTVQNTVFPSRGAGYDPTQIPDSGWQVGPRLGFAWDPWGDGKTVVRAYTGIYYARTPLLVFAGSVNNYRLPPGDVSTQLPYSINTAAFNAFLATPAAAQYIAITGCNPAAGANTPALLACTPNTVFRQFAIAGINLNSSPLDNLPIPTQAQLSGIATALGQSPNPFVNAQVTGHDENFKNPQSFQYGIGIEREIGTNWVVGVDFGHVKTIHLQRNRDLNTPAPLSAEQYIAFLTANNTPANVTLWSSPNHVFDQIRAAGRTYVPIFTPQGFINPTNGQSFSFPTGSVTTIIRPTNNPAYNPVAANRLALGAVQVRESSAKSLFDEITFRTRLNRSWGVLNAYYTLSRSLSDDDNERDAGGVAYAEPFNFSGEYGYSRLDRRHQFVANPIFFLPYDFEVSSAIRLRSGIPLNAFASGDLNGDGVSNDRPLLSQGNPMERNRFRNRPIYDIDLRVQKTFKFGEVKRLVLSSEFFNLFNLSNIIFPTAGTNTTGGLTGQFCSGQTQLCGLNGVNTNANFRQIRDATTGQILINNVNPGSQVFQMQLGARFMF